MKKIITSFFILALFLAEPALAAMLPNDPYYGRQWYLAKIKADSAWEKISASPDLVIAVIDSGIDIHHPDLAENIWRNQKELPDNGVDDDNNGFIDDYQGWDFFNNVPDPSPKFTSGWTEAGVSHGTMVAGIIAAQGNNSEGVSGVSWRAQIMPLKALNDKGEGRISNVTRAIDYAINNGADIINLSFVSFDYNKGLSEAIRRAHQAGVIIVAAAGNEQSSGEGYNIDKTPIYPACYDGDLGENMVIGVTATDALDQKARFASYGFHCIDIAAPGISFFNIVTPGSDRENRHKYYDGYWSGTSMATPLVSAALALIAQANPELSRREIVNILFASTDNINRLNPDYLSQLGNGRLNLDRAVEMAKSKLYSGYGRLALVPMEGKKDLKLTSIDGNLVSEFSLSSKIKAGFSLSAADLDGDGQMELLTGAPAGQEPAVQIFNSHGKLLKKFLAFDKTWRGGLNLTTADIDNDGQLEIITAPAAKGPAQVRIFDQNGKFKKQLAVGAKNWRGGLNIAAGNLDGKGGSELVVSFGSGNQPLVQIFDYSGRKLGSFLAYEKNFTGGVRVAVANLNGRQNHNQAEIIVSPGKGREPLVKIFNNHAVLQKQFLAYGQNWKNGVNLAAGDLNNDGLAEIATAAYPGAAPHVRIFSGRAELIGSFYAWEEGFNGGVNLGIIKINN